MINNTIKYFKISRKGYLYFLRGLNHGLPIGLGYLPVSFTFGMLAVSSGISAWEAIIISLTNLTSAGQFAGMGLIVKGSPIFEIAITTFVINLRYMLMSLSLSQKLKPGISVLKRMLLAFGITDEIFTVASLEKREITFPYMMGLITLPYIGWGLGTLLGAGTTSLLPKSVQSSMGIALYGMFIALIVPATKKSKAVVIVIASAIILSSILKWLPMFSNISSGYAIIICTVIASALGAFLFPREGD